MFKKFLSGSLVAGWWMLSTALPVAADSANVNSQSVQSVWVGIWPFIALILALILLTGVLIFIYGAVRLAMVANNPTGRQQIEKLLFREFWILACAGGYNMILAIILGTLSM